MRILQLYNIAKCYKPKRKVAKYVGSFSKTPFGSTISATVLLPAVNSQSKSLSKLHISYIDIHIIIIIIIHCKYTVNIIKDILKNIVHSLFIFFYLKNCDFWTLNSLFRKFLKISSYFFSGYLRQHCKLTDLQEFLILILFISL